MLVKSRENDKITICMTQPSLLKKFLLNLEKNKIRFVEEKWLLALSGGPDSVALFHLCHLAGINFEIAHFNYNLRGDDSRDDEKFVRNLAHNYNVKAHIKSISEKEFSPHFSIQEHARNLRYDWFKELRERNGFPRIVTAHHGNDNVETYLFNILRGTGIAGLSGISFSRDYVLRPLLSIEKTEIINFLEQIKADFRIDKSNESSKYTRNRIRNEVIPLMEEIRPGFKKAIQSEIKYFSWAEELLEYEFSKFEKERLEKTEKGYQLKLPASHNELLIFPLWLQKNGFRVSEIESILDFPSAQAGRMVQGRDFTVYSLTDGFNIVRNDTESLKESEIQVQSDPIKLESPLKIETAFPEKPGADWECFDFAQLDFPLTLRRWERGDRIKPIGMKGSKKISDLLTDEKIGRADKKDIYVLVSGDEIIWVPGIRRSRIALVNDATRQIWGIRLY